MDKDEKEISEVVTEDGKEEIDNEEKIVEKTGVGEEVNVKDKEDSGVDDVTGDEKANCKGISEKETDVKDEEKSEKETKKEENKQRKEVKSIESFGYHFDKG